MRFRSALSLGFLVALPLMLAGHQAQNLEAMRHAVKASSRPDSSYYYCRSGRRGRGDNVGGRSAGTLQRKRRKLARRGL